MKTTLQQLRDSAAFGLLLPMPFIVLELWNQPVSRHDFPFLLFGWIWLLSSLFVMLAHSVVTTLRTGIMMKVPMQFLTCVGFLLLIVVMWGGLMIDQFPCFLGVPNCD